MMSPFEKLKASCLKKKELFTDPDFIAENSSVFYHQTSPVHFVWKRPKEIFSDPVFVDDTPEKSKLTAGKLGDSRFISCISCLSSLRGLFFRVVPADQGFSSNQGYAGLFRFRIWWCGEWREVVVDDRLPTALSGDILLFAHSPNGGAFWPALLEKAYAKLHGSYEALRYGSSLECLSDLTGGITESLVVGPNICAVLNALLSMTTVVTAVAYKQIQTAPDVLPKGIANGLNYRVFRLEKVKTKELEETTLVWMGNPRHLDTWYSGRCEEFLHENGIKRKEDQFCMLLDEFGETFDSLESVHLDGATSSVECSLMDRMPWHPKLFEGLWQKGVNAGGCRNHYDTFHVNPQFQLVVSEQQEIVICLSQYGVLDLKVIGFSLYQMSKPTSDVLGKSFFKVNKSILNSPYSNSRQVCARCRLNQGCYVLLPTTFEPHQEAKYTLRLLSAKPGVRMGLLDLSPSLMKPAIILAPKPEQHVSVSSYEAVFLRLADEHKTLSAFELLELLETCLPDDYVKSCATLEVCRQIILALDKGRSGRLRYQDYKNLMCSLKLWQTIFRSHSRGSSGILRAEKLRGALMDVGFQVNTEVLSLLVIRYMRKDGTLRFGDFVLCILHLMVAFGTFEKKDFLQNGFVKTTLSEWLQASLQC